MVYRIEHLPGSPHGPSLTSGRTFAEPLFVPLVTPFFVCVLPVISLSPSVAFFTPSPSPLAAPPGGPYSHAKLTLLTAFPNDSPWIVAISNSSALGCRDPSPPYRVLLVNSACGNRGATGHLQRKFQHPKVSHHELQTDW